jgi:hypothetical protein
MLNYLIAGTKRVFGLHQPGREMLILPDDTFLVSYPKSGNTWARLLLANLLSPEKAADFWTINWLIPELETVTKRQLVRMQRPRIIKSHFVFDPRFPKVIYIVRDPRDVVISEYHYQRKTRKIPDQYPMNDYVSRFVEGKTYPNVGSWGQNVASWICTRDGDPGFLLLRYESLLSDTVRQLSRIADFLRISVTSQRLAEVVELSSADRMRKLEATQSHASSLMKNSRKDVPFVRAAKSGSWKDELDKPLVEKIEVAWGPLMRHLGYELRFPSASGSFDLPISPAAVTRTGEREHALASSE